MSHNEALQFDLLSFYIKERRSEFGTVLELQK